MSSESLNSSDALTQCTTYDHVYVKSSYTQVSRHLLVQHVVVVVVVVVVVGDSVP